MRVNKEKIIYYYFIALPVLDSINGVLSRQYGKSIGTYYHVLLTAILFFFAISRNSKIKKKYILPLIIFGISTFISILFNYLIIDIGKYIEIELLVKLACTVINLFSLFVLVDTKRINNDLCDKILSYTAIMIPISFFIAKITGLGNSAYIGSEKGFLGFYSSSNELNAIILILVYFSLTKFKITRKIYYLICYFLLVLCAVLIESKMSILMCAVSIVLLIISELKRINLKVSIKVIGVLLIVFIAVIVNLGEITNIINSFIERQTGLQGLYGNGNRGFIDYFTSGRTTRSNNIISFSYDYPVWIVLVRILIGNGFCNYYSLVYFEMEYFDLFVWGGAIQLLLLIWLTYKIIKRGYRLQSKSLIKISSVVVAFMASFAAGHVLCGGVGGIYFALTCVNTCTHISEDDKSKHN